jgi:hypothetical protein
MTAMTFDTKIAVVLREDLATWQKLNVTAFLVSGIAGTIAEIMGDPYEDGTGNLYMPMFRQPVMVFQADASQIQRAYDRAMAQEIRLSIFTEELFGTGNDIDNRAAVKAKLREEMRLVGFALHDKKKRVDKALDGLKLHK